MRDSFWGKLYIRNLEAGNLIENFLVSAVSSFLAIRFFLNIFNYPQLGKGEIHIAHMLWGGLLMVIALIITFSFLTKHAQIIASIIGGVGFGAFIDELGKFITRDNNYFFQPTIAFIYILFILLFLLSREMDQYRKLSKTEYLINALEVSKEAIISDLNEEEKQKTLDYLKKYSSQNQFTIAFTKMIEKSKIEDENKLNFFSFIAINLKKYYFKIIQKEWFIKIVIAVFVFQSLLFFQHFRELIKTIPSIFPLEIPFFKIAELIFSVVSGFLALLGIMQIKKNRLNSFNFLKKSTLVSIFLTQFFAFYSLQLYALGSLILNLIILSALNYAIKKEHLIENEASLVV